MAAMGDYMGVGCGGYEYETCPLCGQEQKVSAVELELPNEKN